MKIKKKKLQIIFWRK